MNEEYPLVSVIVTTYNRKELLKETIYSILNQTFKDFELIVVDNFSDYDFFSHIESFNDNCIRPFQNKNNGIIAVNRNYGIKKTRGEYIAFCDDDDLWYPDKLTHQLETFGNNSYGLCFTNLDYINRYGKKINRKHKIKKRYRNITFNKFILAGGCIANSTVMIKREVVDIVGLINEDCRLIAVEDYNFWARILKKYRAVSVDKELVSYRINSLNSIGNATKNNWFGKEIYVLNSINSAVRINIIIYSLKVMKLILVGAKMLFVRKYEK